MKIVSIRASKYKINPQPDYKTVGEKIDEVIEKNFEGKFLARAISLTDHQKYNLDQLVDIIAKTRTDKYDPNRKGVAHEEFEPYMPDLQAELIEVRKGRLKEPFGQRLVKLFYENTLLDRGYRLRIDLILLYDPKKMDKAKKVDNSKPDVSPNLEQYLWRFKDPGNKKEALAGLIKILR